MKSVLLASLLALAAPVFAQNAPPPAGDPSSSPAPQAPGQRAHERFIEADADHDGRLSRTEAKGMPFVARHFDLIDTNHDGYVSRDELRAARGKMQAMRQQRAGQRAADPEGTN